MSEVHTLIEVAKKFISIDTTSAQGIHEGVLFLENYATSSGLACEKISTSSFPDLYTDIKIYSQPSHGDEEIIFASPIRTSDPGSHSLWDKTMSNPFKLHLEGDKVYGLGVAKSKIDLLAKIKALSKLRKKNIVVLGSSGETEAESSVLKLIRKKHIKPSFVYVGAPTNLQVYTAGCGVLSVEINLPFSKEEQAFRRKWDSDGFAMTQSKIFIGKAAHSSELKQENNAIIKMLNYLSQLPQGIVVLNLDGGLSYNTIPPEASLEVVIDAEAKSETLNKVSSLLGSIQKIEKNFMGFKEEGFSPQVSTLSLGKIKTFKNHIRIVGSCRILPSVPESNYRKWMDEFKESCEELGGHFEILSYRRPFSIDANHDAIKALRAAIESSSKPFVEKKTTHSTEANLLSRFKIPAVVFGSGMSENNVNSPNEWNSLSAIEDSVEIYKLIMKEI